MARSTRYPLSRRGVLKAATTGLPAALGLVVLGTDVARAAKAPKNAVNYQDEPKDDERCSGCQHFVPADGDGPGACKVVKGEIAPSGWCMLFAPQG